MDPFAASDIVIVDETEKCPYLPEETARMPLRMPKARISRREADLRLAQGHRRTGEFVYRTECPSCQACEPIRIDCTEFTFSRNQRRALNKGDRTLVQRLGPLEYDAQRIDLFNKHRRMRGLAKLDSDIDTKGYVWGFVQSCFDSFEITYWQDERIVCVAVCDIGATCLSAVYTFFDPEMAKAGLGTYSILKQIEFCQIQSLRYVYLGYYVAGSPHMQYKSRFTPHERLIDGEWNRYS
ncbi:MAG: arginyl-tRNA--protein-N-Asp/Glu arginylyltransferase [Mariniblastus sp.]|jgi:arginyl-tRNA--protein-N-Asp/Glu arginylyltransferase